MIQNTAERQTYLVRSGSYRHGHRDTMAGNQARDKRIRVASSPCSILSFAPPATRGQFGARSLVEEAGILSFYKYLNIRSGSRGGVPGESSAEERDSGDPERGKVSSSKLPLIFLTSELLSSKMAFPGGSAVKNTGQCRRCGFSP